MSHTTTIKGLAIKSASAIRAAVERMRKDGVNVELLEKAVPRMYFESQARDVGECDFVLKFPESRYDLGLKKEGEEYTPYFDSWAGEIQKNIGARKQAVGADPQSQVIGRFLQDYATEAAIEVAEAEGWVVEDSSVDEDGNVNLTFAVM